MIDLLLRARDHCDVARQAGKTTLSARRTRGILRDYHAILKRALTRNPRAEPSVKRRGRIKQSIAFNLIHRIREHADAVLRFATDLRAPFASNLAERAIRMPRVKQKISGCFRALKGAQTFCTIRSYLDTICKQGHHTFEVLRLTFFRRPLSPDSG
jgi:transposase